MKKILIVAAAAGLMSVAACTSTNNETVNVTENVEAVTDNLDAGADLNATNEVVADNAAAPVENATGN